MASVWPVLLLLLPLALLSLQTRAQPVRVLISNMCAQDGARDTEMDLDPGSPLVLTHRIRLLPGSGSACGQCEVDFAALRERIERLEKEVSELRERCGGAEGCCGSQQSKGALCTTVRPTTDECPDDCSDQGRCVGGKCVCFAGFSGPDCSVVDCPENCSNRGRCVDGQCVCDPGFSGLDCSSSGCPDNCSNRGRCVNGRCVCDSGVTGQDCSERSCPGNCHKRGRCVNGQCLCDSGFSGPDCSERSCPGNCNNRGRCVNGQCMCDSGFTGQDCSERSCPGNCNKRGRCVNSQCVCDSGFSGPDCSVKACPDNCNNRGQCVNGKCVCESGFTGPDCSSRSCPGDCSDHGRCIDGLCVCESGFTGADCASKTCPGDCNNKGRCVNGQCVCDVGFSGQDCSTKTCPNNCSNRGRCVRGRCVCRRGFTGPDCSECQSGFTGENCDTALMGVSRLNTRDITESSVTVFWTPPPALLYDTYHITFTSTKETEQKISSKISGGLSSYTQTGLAAGQEYTVTITGEKDGMMGSESAAQFTTRISGPKNLRVVKTSTTSVIVQWEKAQGEIDRYVLSVSPNQTDGSSGLPDMNLPPERDSAQIDGLDPGRLYDLSLVAERDSARSLPASVQATPGKASASASRMTVGIESGNSREKTPPFTNSTLFLRNRPLKTSGRVENSDRTGNFSRLRPGIFRPGLKRPLPMGKPGMFPKPRGQPGMIRRPTPGIKHFNSSQIGTKGQIVGLSSNQSKAESPLRPMNPSVGSVSDGKPVALTVKEARAQEGDSNAGFSEETTVSSIQKHTRAAPSASSQTPEPTEEPTTTTEKNLTAYINETKCVRKVLVGYRKIHGNASDGSLLSKNMTVVVGHVNGNDVLHTLLTGRSVGNTGLHDEQNTADVSEARRTVKEEDVDEENESVPPFSTRQPDTAHQLPRTSTPPVPQQTTEARPPQRNTVQSSLSIHRPPAGPKPPGSSRPPSGDRPRSKTPSSALKSPAGSAEEPIAEKKELNRRIPSTTKVQESIPLPVRFQLRSDSVIKNRHAGASDLMAPHRTPYRPPLLRRPHVTALQNRTRSVLDPAEIPRRALTRNNRTLSRVSPAPPEIPAGRTGSSLRNEPTGKLSRGSPAKHRAATHVDTNTAPDGKGNSDGSVSTDQLMENDNKAQKYELRRTDGSTEVNKSTPAGLELIWTAQKGKFRHLVINELGEENKEEDEMDEGGGGRDSGEDEETHQREPGGGKRTSSLSKGAVSDVVPAVVNEEMKNRGENMTAAHSRPLTSVSLSVYGKGPAFGSKSHSLTIHTGPEPPSDLVFSDVTDSSFTVSWTKPKSRVSGFKITHTHIQEGEPISVSVDSETQRLELSAKAPGSTYEVRVMSVLGQDESDSITETVTTLPDPPTDLKAINVTDSKALLLWRPALATIDHYIIVYSSDTAPGSRITVKVSGNAAEQQLQALRASTRYSVSIQSHLGDLSSSSATAHFSTSSGAVGAADGPRDLKASRVTPRSAVLSWQPPEAPVSGYKLSYYTDEQGMKETILEPTVTEIQLSRLFSSSSYTAHLQAERGGLYMTAISTQFTTGSLRFPFPTDCSQEQQNGALESGTLEVYPQGRTGRTLTVYCDMETDGGGWTVFQRRKDGKTNFFRKWREYSSGFGALDGEFWLGNEMLHNFTKMSPMVLRVDLRAGDESAYARYSSFSIDSAKKHYTLRVSGYSGTAGDSLSYHNGRPFSTRDKDPRSFVTRCAMSYRGGWWYKNCHEANLNGLYNTAINHQGVIWTAWKGQDFSIPFTEMKFRPASFRP